MPNSILFSCFVVPAGHGGYWDHAGMRVIWPIVFRKWKAEPSGMHSHAEHGNEEALATLSRFVFVVNSSNPESLIVSLLRESVNR